VPVFDLDGSDLPNRALLSLDRKFMTKALLSKEDSGAFAPQVDLINQLLLDIRQ
jgi:hypothetical protein